MSRPSAGRLLPIHPLVKEFGRNPLSLVARPSTAEVLGNARLPFVIIEALVEKHESLQIDHASHERLVGLDHLTFTAFAF